MAELAFHGPDGIASVSVLDNVEVEIIDGKLAAGGPPLAFHSNGLWQIGSVSISRIECHGPVQLNLCIEGERKRFGPFPLLVVGATTIWTGERALARYSAFTKSWLVYAEAPAERTEAMRDDRLGDLGQIQPKYALAR